MREGWQTTCKNSYENWEGWQTWTNWHFFKEIIEAPYLWCRKVNCFLHNAHESGKPNVFNS